MKYYKYALYLNLLALSAFAEIFKIDTSIVTFAERIHLSVQSHKIRNDCTFDRDLLEKLKLEGFTFTARQYEILINEKTDEESILKALKNVYDKEFNGYVKFIKNQVDGIQNSDEDKEFYKIPGTDRYVQSIKQFQNENDGYTLSDEEIKTLIKKEELPTVHTNSPSSVVTQNSNGVWYTSPCFLTISGILLCCAIGGGAYMMTKETAETDLRVKL